MVNQTILGFSSTLGGPISLTSIRSDRKISIYIGNDLYLIPELWHDSNKMYTLVKGFHGTQELDLEDIGCFFEITSRQHQPDPCLSLQHLMGGSWINDQQSVSLPILICIKKFIDEKWTCFMGDVEDLSRHIQPATYVLPIVCPIRQETENGILFIG
jgi:hypothetical protein